MTLNLIDKLLEAADQWRQMGFPSRQVLFDTADRLERWKREQPGFTTDDSGPTLLTATLDDAMGQGLDVIERFADLMGCRVRRLGLLLPAEEIIDACHRLQPDMLGATVLQFDSEEELAHISRHLPEKTFFIAGGPVFAPGDNFAQRCGIHAVARDAGAFIRLLAPRLAGGSTDAVP